MTRFTFTLRVASSLAQAVAIVFALSALVTSDANANSAGPIGHWWADDGAARVEIRVLDGALIGSIVWLREALEADGTPLRDRRHPDSSMRARPVVGIEMLHGFRADAESSGTWSGGSIYDPANGRTYQGTITMKDRDQLLLRGFIGISLFGRTTTWTRFDDADPSTQSTFASEEGD